jgi:hypothetical protein
VSEDCVETLLGFSEVLPIHCTAAGAGHSATGKAANRDALRLNDDCEPSGDASKRAPLQFGDEYRRCNDFDTAILRERADLVAYCRFGRE